jgi:hypothetical protein
MSEQRLRDRLNEHVNAAQNSIQLALQKLHDDTGLIPSAVHFDAVDVRTIEQWGKEKAILISNVDVRANT